MGRKCNDMNSVAKLAGASRCWMGISQLHLFWKGWRCLNGLVLLFSICGCSIIIGVPSREWPYGILVVPTRCCTSQKVYCIIFAMFSPMRISARSCSHVIFMCEIRSQELADSPPKMCVTGATKTFFRLYYWILFKPLYLVGIESCLVRYLKT